VDGSKSLFPTVRNTKFVNFAISGDSLPVIILLSRSNSCSDCKS
jgi:hypothetical protein